MCGCHIVIGHLLLPTFSLLVPSILCLLLGIFLGVFSCGFLVVCISLRFSLALNAACLTLEMGPLSVAWAFTDLGVRLTISSCALVYSLAIAGTNVANPALGARTVVYSSSALSILAQLFEGIDVLVIKPFVCRVVCLWSVVVLLVSVF